MTGHRRSLLSLGLAALLPVILFAAVQVLFIARQDREQTRSTSLAHAKEAMLQVDAAIKSALTVLRVMAPSTLEAGEFPALYERTQRALHPLPLIEGVVLWDARTRKVRFVSYPSDKLHPLAGEIAWPFDQVEFHPDEPVIRGVESQGGDSRPAICLLYPVFHDGQLVYVLSATLEPKVFQDILLSYASPNTVGGIVDQAGRFIARSSNYQERFGQLATVYTRNAIAHGSQGFYTGKTYEGFDNYSAFYKSKFSGWSAHLGVASSELDDSRRWSFVAAGLAGLGAVLLAAVLIALVLRDIEERRRNDEALRQSQKMEAVGQLTGGIAHDFNNLLTAMIGGLDLIVQRTAHDDRIHKFAVNALAAAHRGAKLTSQLLAFSRSQKMALTTVDLDELINSMSELLLRSVGPAVHLKVNIAATARYVVSDPIQLEFALLNLAANARDALPKGGELSISSSVAEARFCTTLPKGDYVQIEVSDTGIGMSEEVRARALEPFFTTKSLGEGTGLGLSQVFGVMRQSNGTVHLTSTPGEGTRVYLILPRAEAPREVVINSDTVAQLTGAAPASIMVVDDDAQVRKVVVEALRAHGYYVAEAENGARALSLLADTQPQLMLIDFAMPGANGAEVARLAKQRYPHISVLLMSGYADTAAISAGIGDVPLLRKPFDTAWLLKAVADVLAARSH